MMRSNFCWLIVGFLLLLVFSCCSSKTQSNGEKEEISYETRVKIKQYVSEGRKLYNQNCANCHQVNGEGLASLYPPVKNSDYLINDIDAAICYVKNGLKGEITVNGKTFNQEMPANSLLTDLELAEIITYVVNELNNQEQLVSQKEVRRKLKSCEKKK